jgi:hypothetical protein
MISPETVLSMVRSQGTAKKAELKFPYSNEDQYKIRKGGFSME